MKLKVTYTKEDWGVSFPGKDKLNGVFLQLACKHMTADLKRHDNIGCQIVCYIFSGEFDCSSQGTVTV